MSPDPNVGGGETQRPIPWTAVAVLAVLLLWALRNILILVGFAALLAYALDPPVSALQHLRLPRLPSLPRPLAAALVMLALVFGLGWAVSFAAPRLAHELTRFANALPATLERLSTTARDWARSRGFGAWLGADESALPEPNALAHRLTGAFGSLAARIFGGLGQLVGMVLVPVLAFYLLAEREAVQSSAMRFIPHATRGLTLRVLAAVDRALRSYVRGQSLVCLTMGAATGLALQILHFPVALLLGVIVALAEVVPFLGFWTAAIAIALTGFGVSPIHAVSGLVAYAAINQTVNLFITPRLMSRHMKMHPFVITVSILAGGTLLGAGGAILALPGAAALQSLIAEFAPRPESGPGGAASGGGNATVGS